MKLSKSLLSLQPDAFSRYYVILSLLLQRYGKKKITILEVGGKESLLPELIELNNLPYKLTITDILPLSQKDKRYEYIEEDFLDNKFKDNSFTVVVSTDVLEHIPDDYKSKFLLEMHRISKKTMIVAAPFYSEEIDYAERRANGFFKKLTGSDHPWLKEHFEQNKPDLKKVNQLLQDHKMNYLTFKTANLENWILTLIPNLLPARLNVDKEKLADINSEYNSHLLEYGDFENPGYRTFIVVDKENLIEIPFNLNKQYSVEKQIKFRTDIYELLSEEILKQESRLQRADMKLKEMKRDTTQQLKQADMKLKEMERESVLQTKKMNELAYYQEHANNLQQALDQIFNSKTYKIWQGFNKVKKTAKLVLKNPSLVYKTLKQLTKKENWALIRSKIAHKINNSASDTATINEQYKIWLQTNCPSKKQLKQQFINQKKFKYRPKISIITPLYKTDHVLLKEMIESVIKQTYDNWELCLADDASNDPELIEIIKSYQRKDNRIKLTVRNENGHICQTSNSALKLATGEFVALLDHDDVITPHALYENIRLLNAHHKADLIYSDEDKLDEDSSERIEPFFKPDWSPNYLRSINYITHFAVIRKSIIDKIGGFRTGFEGAQDWDLFLRISNVTDNIYHIPDVLYSWRKSSTSTASEKHAQKAKSYAYMNQAKVLESDLDDRGLKGEVLKTEYLGLWRVKYKIKDKPLVSIIIPTKDKYEYISKLLDSLIKKTTYSNYELLLVDTGSTDGKVQKLYEKTKQVHKNTKILKWSKKFNFASVCNFGAKQARGDYLLFLNNDTEVITPDWIESMLEHAQRERVGAVGAKLLYPDKTIQHAGVVLGIGGVANHAYQHVGDLEPATFPMMYAKDAVRDVSAVTGACLMCKKDVFYEVKGFDKTFRIAYNDIDFCLKLLNKGYQNIYTPFARLYHHENVSVGNPFQGTRNYNEFMRENEMMYERWGKIIKVDTFYNLNISKKYTDFSLNI